jgi:hypothetical protein
MSVGDSIFSPRGRPTGLCQRRRWRIARSYDAVS